MLNKKRKMKTRFLSFVSIALFVTLLTSCSGKTDGSQELIDSLQNALNEQKSDYSRLNEYLTIISDGLDSINIQETSIFQRNAESPLPNREQIKRDLTQFRQTLKEQKDKIASLEKKLKGEKSGNSKLQSIIKTLKAQLEEKDVRIAQLEKEIENNNVNISQLQTKVSTLNEQNAVQEEIISAQDKMLNECYYLVASKKELKALGILEGGNLFKKRKVNLGNIPTEKFKTVDIRNFSQIKISSRKAKLLSPAPSGSYSLEKDGNSYTLTIHDASAFWSVSNYLVIQTD